MSYTVYLMQVGYGVSFHRLELSVYINGGLMFFYSKETHVGESIEQGLQQRWGGHGELHGGVGLGHLLEHRSHKGYIAESREAYDQNVSHFL